MMSPTANNLAPSAVDNKDFRAAKGISKRDQLACFAIPRAVK
jgi:hypothetical protein